MASLSLRKRFSHRVLIPFILGAFGLCSAVWVMDYYTQRGYSQESLHQRMKLLSVSFSAYLDRANFEVKYLSEQIGNGETLDDLFQLHDVLFFGGLDFFYIELEDSGQVMEDPRVRLYTQDNLTELIKKAQINVWRHISSTDHGELLVLKKPLKVGSSGQSKGFFYGFLSLNNNLALASDLLTSSEADYIRISDVAGNELLLEKQTNYSDDVSFISHEDVFSIPELEDTLALELRFSRPLTEAFSGLIMVGCAVILACLLLLFWAVQFYAQRIMFTPIAGLPALGRDEAMNFVEFQPLLAQMNRFQVQLKVRDQHLELLSNSLQSAILFCDESSHVTGMNTEAKELFPNYTQANTVFDMTPIVCHQPIQRALKGEYSGEFELEFPDQQKLYEFNTYSFINEHGFRSVMLVGHDVSEVRRLRWHLTHRFPRHTFDRPLPSSQLMLDELKSCATHLEESPQSTMRWLNVVGELLVKINHLEEGAVQKMPLGQLVMALQDELEESLKPNAKQRDYNVELSLADAEFVSEWNSDHRSLLKVAFLICMNSSISERYITIAWEKSSLVIKILGSEELTPALDWMSQEYPKLVKGRVDLTFPSRVTLTATMVTEALHESPHPVGERRVAFVKNDYVNEARLVRLLADINIYTDVFSSFAEFYGSGTPYRSKYDVMFVGIGNVELARNGVEKLLASSGSESLPVVYIGAVMAEELDGLSILEHHLMPYRLASIIQQLDSEPIISLGDWATHTTSFVVTGGAGISQVIWQSELNANGFVARREADVSSLVSVLRQHSPVIILVLDKEAAKRAIKLHLTQLGNTKWLVLEDFDGRPDTMTFVDVGGRLPNDGALEVLLQNLNIKGETI